MNFRVPVFTPFNDDKEQTINYEIIDKYASYLKKSGLQAILVNGTTGEGMCLSVIERKKVTESWLAACRKYDINIMVQISGCPYPDVIELAKHAESIKVDSILCLPELYFKPKTEEKLIAYLKGIAEYCTLPIFYYHIPKFTDVNLNMPKFCDLAEKEISNFGGIKFSSGDLDQGTACLRPGRSIYLGCGTVLCGAMVLGFDSAIMTILNIFPDFALLIAEFIENGELEKAQATQKTLNSKIKEILQNGNGQLAPSMKKAFNSMVGLKIGNTRKPL